MFCPISFDDYVEKHLAANPSVAREDRRELCASWVIRCSMSADSRQLKGSDWAMIRLP